MGGGVGELLEREWVEGDGGAWDRRMSRGRWGLLGWGDGWSQMGSLEMGGWVEGDGGSWNGRMGRGR